MKNLWYRGTVVVAVGAVVLFGLHTYVSRSSLTESIPNEAIDAELTLQAVTLEQPDVDGNLLWRLEADSVKYVPETQRAELLALEGEFYEEGKKIYTVVADEGEVQQNGDTLFLRGNLVATRIEDDLTLVGELLKWQPKLGLLRMGNFENEDLSEDMLARSPVTVSDPQMEAIAQSLVVNNKENRVTMSGDVVAKSKVEPWLTFASEALTWLTDQSLIEADQMLTVERFASEDYETLTERLVGQTGNARLDENIVTIEQSVQLESLSEGLTVKSDRAVWDVSAQTVEMDRPVDIAQPARQLTALANQASIDLAEQIIYLVGNVRANGRENDTRLRADRVTWATSTQQVEAEGNVRYQQAANPEATLSGPRAVGNIEDGTLVVIGDASNSVVTEIVPEDF
ncbi:LPS export ABC transporter periplasmic protein LptC [cf. Phormidesmis sp. LEGE 11477]|uniref:LPS export ABC transporter periplasmic protein LptC n=1 Tax=cf. Phormidesmis sp. LEGE 11477 TaxID=1828680 RepID=UPI00187E4DF5|nr:LPS export ABC transporter periplasmic protein LptC [cf. Phormidesmis sp. LEGE 11477]MBE9063909.1 LPS export ABC transporter periplasmic protein LptC [cf. Phormidesmis sp. LEGE 11477]